MSLPGALGFPPAAWPVGCGRPASIAVTCPPPEQGQLTSDERAELARLRKESRELRREKDFFRLAATHFAKEQLPPRGFV